jgi:hypothetical protein
VARVLGAEWRRRRGARIDGSITELRTRPSISSISRPSISSLRPSISSLGKESNLLDDVESGMVHSAQDVYTESIDPRRDEWQTMILPVLKKMPLSSIIEKTGMSRRGVMDLRAGRSRPHRKNREKLTRVARECLPSE